MHDGTGGKNSHRQLNERSHSKTHYCENKHQSAENTRQIQQLNGETMAKTPRKCPENVGSRRRECPANFLYSFVSVSTSSEGYMQNDDLK